MRLTECFINIIAYVGYFLKSAAVRQPSYDQVRTDIQRLIAESERCLENGTVSRGDYDLARFAIFAWIDEAILSSTWDGKTHWQREKLQRIYYETDDAGEKFFEKLDLNTIGPHQRDIREIYYLCLAMGFTGQYCNEGDEFLLEQVKSRNLKILFGSSMGMPSLDEDQLFSEAYQDKPAKPPDSGPRLFSPLTLMCLGVPVVIYLMLFIYFSLDLKRLGEEIIKLVS
jgi:type VI secretion system protein ImpK